MKYIFTFGLAALMTFTVGCSGEAHHSHSGGHSHGHIDISDDRLASAKDPVCGMPVSGEGIADTTMNEGKIYGFCNTACKDEFNGNPGKYLSAN